MRKIIGTTGDHFICKIRCFLWGNWAFWGMEMGMMHEKDHKRRTEGSTEPLMEAFTNYRKNTNILSGF